MNQKNAFLASEANSFFERNRRSYIDISSSAPPSSLRLFSRFLAPEHRVLEIGCAAGRNLYMLRRMVGCSCCGVDPSDEAVRCGSAQYPDISLTVGTADDLPFEDATFDFVLFGFCLYLVDRELLPRAVAEADRVLKDRGFLAITDFDPSMPTVREYKHMPGILSFKMDYSRLFTAYPNYVLAEKISYSHAADGFCADPQERVSSVLLHKDVSSAYTRVDP